MSKRKAEELTPGEAKKQKITIMDVLAAYRPKVQGIIAEQLPRKFDEESINRFCGEPSYAYDIDSATKSLLVPIWDMLDRGGKRWRPILVLLIADCLGGKEDIVKPFAYLCEIVHNGTLAVDDIEDSSTLRRGKKCMHLLFGGDVAINAGNAMYFFPLVCLRELRENKKCSDEVLVKAYELYSQELINLHFGQGLDIWWHNDNSEPGIQEYLQMCAYKTGTLARLSARLATLLSGGDAEQIKRVGRFAESIGVAFQIQDDLLNISGEEFVKGKGLGEDVHEGKRSLMVIHCLLNHPSEDKRKRLGDILKMKTDDEKLIKEAIAIMRESKSLKFAQDMARDIIQKAWNEVKEHLPENEAKGKLKLFADYLIERKI